MQKFEKQKGITLIALIITIIVMLILVGVSVSVALNGGLFSTAQTATDKTQIELEKERLLSIVMGAIENNGKVAFSKLDEDIAADGTFEGTSDGATKGTYTSRKTGNTYTVESNGSITLIGQTGGGSEGPGDNEGTQIGLPEGWTVAETKPDGWSDKVTAITDGSNTIPLPNGYEISEVAEEQTVTTGLVISDANANEFVWIPVTEELGSSYSYSTNYSEPTELTSNYSSSNAPCDSQATLDYFYGTGYYNYEEDFNYEEEYVEMVTSVNKYDGFYIGRYETTIDSEGNIGSEYNTEVLTAGSILKEGTNTNNNDEYHYRWYGLYYAQKNANVSGNGDNVQTAMIYGVLWDKTMDYIRAQKTAGNTTYDVDTATATWHGSANGHTAVVNSAQANAGDVALNIWDLESNAAEWTQEAESTKGYRVSCGRNYSGGGSASTRLAIGYPGLTIKSTSSRIALYIKQL